MEPGDRQLLPDASIASLVLMLATGAVQYLGLAPDPITKKPEANLDLAKHAIDTLEVLKEKTTGNLTDDEAELLGGLLHDLRLKYLAALERGTASPKPATPPPGETVPDEGEKTSGPEKKGVE
jgi:hypothetical protein